MAENQGHLLPVYMVADESGSMSPYVDDLNAGLASLRRVLLGEPMTAARIRFSVVGFAGGTTEYLRLADLRQGQEPPPLGAHGGTSYAAVFRDLLRRVPEDVSVLKGQGYRVHRPAVFFLSDGRPDRNEDWRTPHRRLTDRSVTRAAPNIVACGIGDADAETILGVATERHFAFVSVPGAELGDSVAGFCSELTRSVVESGRSIASGTAELTFDRPEGFRMAIDVI
ncbi:hypothetical protein F0L17_09920 [Streptomyces sp. TRM43335]|uniref:VWFA domain-containing protein n=1 Tax=Streptomyces taklimakanensis TaxID=2569853 RepID=A0A6G2BAZ7_9ACTN|nr:hypothetical protein [Streptomyces taklimakanensis]MTE19438.1 hypothetical protein [Streptomyces taklimakanensis]